MINITHIRLRSFWLSVCFILGYRIVAEKAYCSGVYFGAGLVYECGQSSAFECAQGCKGVSSMFAFGRHATESCYSNNKCKCHCFDHARNGTCAQMSKNSYDLYNYTSTIVHTPIRGNTSKPRSKSALCRYLLMKIRMIFW